MTIVGIVAVAFCVLGAVLLAFYREKRVMDVIDKKHDANVEASAEEKIEE